MPRVPGPTSTHVLRLVDLVPAPAYDLAVVDQQAAHGNLPFLQRLFGLRDRQTDRQTGERHRTALQQREELPWPPFLPTLPAAMRVPGAPEVSPAGHRESRPTLTTSSAWSIQASTATSPSSAMPGPGAVSGAPRAAPPPPPPLPPRAPEGRPGRAGPGSQDAPVALEFP